MGQWTHWISICGSFKDEGKLISAYYSRGSADVLRGTMIAFIVLVNNGVGNSGFQSRENFQWILA